MRKFNKVAAQGDVMFIKVDALPPNAVPVAPEGGRVVVAHSETGHNHVMLAERTQMYSIPDSIMDLFLVVGDEGDVLEHLRPTDTHEAISFDAGIYHVRRQREYTPEGFRRVED
jgi:hypothetical protein